MEHHLWRLVWALPLVLIIGVAFIHALKRWGPGRWSGLMPVEPARTELHVVADLQVSDHTRVYLLEAAGQRWLLTEGSQHTAIQASPPSRTP